MNASEDDAVALTQEQRTSIAQSIGKWNSENSARINKEIMKIRKDLVQEDEEFAKAFQRVKSENEAALEKVVLESLLPHQIIALKVQRELAFLTLVGIWNFAFLEPNSALDQLAPELRRTANNSKKDAAQDVDEFFAEFQKDSVRRLRQLTKLEPVLKKHFPEFFSKSDPLYFWVLFGESFANGQ